MEVRERGKRDIWRCDETLFYIQILKKKNVLKLLKGKRYRVEEVFKLFEKEFRQAGFTRTGKQLLIKYKGLKKSYYDARRNMSKDGTNANVTCPYYQELCELFGPKQIAIKQEETDCIDSSPVYQEACSAYNFCDLGNEALPNGLVMESPVVTEVRGMYDDLADPRDGAIPGGSRDCDAIATEILPDSKPAMEAAPMETHHETKESVVDDNNDTIPRASAIAGAKRTKRLSSSRPFTRQQSFFVEQREAYKEIAREIMRSQEKMIEKTIQEQRRLEERSWAAQRDILLEQTNLLVAGLRGILCPESSRQSNREDSRPEIGKQTPNHIYPSVTPSPSTDSLSPSPEEDTLSLAGQPEKTD